MSRSSDKNRVSHRIYIYRRFFSCADRHKYASCSVMPDKSNHAPVALFATYAMVKCDCISGSGCQRSQNWRFWSNKRYRKLLSWCSARQIRVGELAICDGIKFRKKTKKSSKQGMQFRAYKGVFIAIDATQLNSTSSCRHVHIVNNCHLSLTQLTQFVCHDVINKNTTNLAVRCSTGSVEFSSVQLSCVAINTP